jgi:hypothetical protein
MADVVISLSSQERICGSVEVARGHMRVSVSSGGEV